MGFRDVWYCQNYTSKGLFLDILYKSYKTVFNKILMHFVQHHQNVFRIDI